MSDLVKSIEKQIEVDKELINVLPKAEIKQITKLIEEIKKMQDKYEQFNKSLLKEINTRYKKYMSVEKNPQIDIYEQEIKKLNQSVDIVDNRTAFQKLDMDKLVYNINGYYKKSLSSINIEIIEWIKRFESIGIRISGKDFTISEFANEYMTVLIEESRNGVIDSDKVKDTFEKIYWKCPELISQIYVNIRMIYEIYQSEIEKYFKNIIAQKNENEENLENEKKKIIKKKKRLQKIDGNLILNDFFRGELNINEYKSENYLKTYQELVSTNLEQMSKEEKNELDQNMEKLYDNILEYQIYLQFKFLNDEILKIRNEEIAKREQEEKEKKKKSKSEVELLNQDIKKQITEILKMNTLIEKMNKKKVDEQKKEELVLKRNKQIIDVKNLYIKLDENMFKEEIVQKIFDTSSILEVLRFASYNFGFLAKSFIKKEVEITDDEIKRKIEELREILKNTSFDVINNICIGDDRPVSITIKDRYKLFGIKLQKDDFKEDNIEDVTKRLKMINTYNNINDSVYSIDNINYILKVREMQKK